MDIAQARLELAIHHLKQVEERLTMQRQKIADLRASGNPSEVEEEQLGSLLRALEVLKTHIANVIDPAKRND